MTIGIVNDVHFGARSNNEFIQAAQIKFFNKFFKDLVKQKIKTVLVLGDFFDKRKAIDFKTLEVARKHFFDLAVASKVHVYILLGNHDVYYKSTNKLSSPQLLLKDYKNVTIIDSPVQLTTIEDVKCCLIPWVTEDNYDECVTAIAETPAPVLFGHFEFVGFEMIKGVESKVGFEMKMFDKFDIVMSGHYHLKSNKKAVHQLGTQYEMDWGDYGITKGYHLYSNENGLEFVVNDDPLHIKYVYDGSVITPDLDSHTGRFVKIMVDSYENKSWFDEFVESIRNQNPADLKIIDNVSVENVVDEFKTTKGLSITEIFSQSVDLVEGVSEASKVNIKSILDNLYIEALKS